MLTLTCESQAQSDDIADLINGYCQLETGVERDIWSREKRESRQSSIILSPHYRSQSGGHGSLDHRKSGSGTLDSPSRSDYAEVLEDIQDDYSVPLGKKTCIKSFLFGVLGVMHISVQLFSLPCCR